MLQLQEGCNFKRLPENFVDDRLATAIEGLVNGMPYVEGEIIDVESSGEAICADVVPSPWFGSSWCPRLFGPTSKTAAIASQP